MVSFTDVAGVAQKHVTVRGVLIPIFGISIRGVVMLFNRFPEIREKWANRDEDEEANLFTGEDLQDLAPRAVSAILAAGIGHPGDPEQEEIADGLGAGEQAELLMEILEATFPRGLAPFVDKLRALGYSEVANLLTSFQSALQGIGKVPDTDSPPQSNAA